MNINKEIFRLSIPNILSNISVPLIATVDTRLMGYLSANHLAAIGSVAMIFNFLYWNFGFLRMGTTGMVAQAYGKQDNHEKSKVFFQAILVALSISSILLIFQGYFADWSITLMNLDDNLGVLAKEYFLIRIWDAPATLFLYIAMAWFFGNQNAVTPLIITIIINVSNIALSYYFVKELQWGIAGVAWGSVIANYLGILTAVFYIWKKYPLVRVKLSELQVGLTRFFHINKDIFLRTLMLSITFFFLYSMTATYSAVILAVNVIILQFTNWMSYAVDGFAYACEALVGRFAGAKDEKNTMKTIKYCFIYGLILGSLFSVAYGVFTEPIARIFTDEQAVLDQILSYRFWIVLFPIIGFASYIWDGVFVGLTASKAMRNTMFFAFAAFLISYYSFSPSMGYKGILLAFSIYLFVRGVSQTWVFMKYKLDLK